MRLVVLGCLDLIIVGRRNGIWRAVYAEEHILYLDLIECFIRLEETSWKEA